MCKLGRKENISSLFHIPLGFDAFFFLGVPTKMEPAWNQTGWTNSAAAKLFPFMYCLRTPRVKVTGMVNIAVGGRVFYEMLARNDRFRFWRVFHKQLFRHHSNSGEISFCYHANSNTGATNDDTAFIWEVCCYRLKGFSKAWSRVSRDLWRLLGQLEMHYSDVTMSAMATQITGI